MASMIKVKHFEDGPHSVAMSVNKSEYVVSWGQNFYRFPKNAWGKSRADTAFDNFVKMAEWGADEECPQ